MLTIALNIYLFAIVPKGFFPQQDTGRLAGAIQAAQDISFQAMREKLTQVVDIVAARSRGRHVMGFTGGRAAGRHHEHRATVHRAEAARASGRSPPTR